jgi:prepilin-type N-terminal cleavage/methylation domain-containing protein/prepilin-type processing-associated H-X9-DG protein
MANPKSQVPSSKSGFTLVELLVVITIVAVLIALLLPAVQAAREAARRLQCLNHLKQISLGVLHYESQWSCMPIDIPENECGDPKVVPTGVSWMVRILPFVEQQSLYNAMKLDGKVSDQKGIITNDKKTRAAIATAIPLYYCPSDTAMGKLTTDCWSDSGIIAALHIPFAQTNYQGVSGPSVDIDQTDVSKFPGATPYCNNWCNYKRHCLDWIWRHSYMTPVKLLSFTDGTSKTLLVGENVPDIDPFAVWALSNGSHSYGGIPLNYIGSAAGNWQEADNLGFHSRHAGGVQFSWVDGHVSWISDTVDMAAFRAFCTRGGGETVSE